MVPYEGRTVEHTLSVLMRRYLRPRKVIMDAVDAFKLPRERWASITVVLTKH